MLLFIFNNTIHYYIWYIRHDIYKLFDGFDYDYDYDFDDDAATN